MTRPRCSICNVALAVALAGAGLAGCSQAPSFPSLPDTNIFGQKTLTPAQQDAEIKDLTEAQVQNTAQAGETESPPKYIPASVTKAQ